MSRFVELRNQLINVDKIIKVVKGNSSASIILEDGHCVDVDRHTIRDLEGLYKEIEGNGHISSVMQAPNGLYAVYDTEYEKGEYEAKEVKLLAILGNGCIESVELLNGRYELCTVCSDYIGTYTKKQIEKEFRCVKFI